MSKISVTGSKKHLEKVIDRLHEMELMDIEDYAGELETGKPMEDAEELSQLLVDIRSVISKMPNGETEKEKCSIDKIEKKVGEIYSDLEELEEEKEDKRREIEKLREKKDFLEKIRGSGLEVGDLEMPESLEIWAGRLDREELNSKLETDQYEVFEGKEICTVIYSAEVSMQIQEAIGQVSNESVSVPGFDDYSGEVPDVVQELEKEIESLEDKIRGLEEQRRELSEKWKGKLAYVEDFLTEKVEKAEAPIMFATTEHAFVARGWIPSERFAEFEESLADVSNGSIHIQEEEVEEQDNPPVKHENSRPVQPFESLTDLVAVPRYNEIDPSALILLTFPLFFGFMIGDAGYGITTGLVFYAGMKMFPDARKIFKALLWTSAATFIFGLLYGEMFGFQIYQSPFYRGIYWTEIFYLTIAIGVLHVNLGILAGAYNEYLEHGLMEAVFAKGSWILLQVAAAVGYITSVYYGAVPGAAAGAGIAVPTLIMLYTGEGIEGIVEIPSLISNILSYLRLFGVGMAAYTLAGTVNALAEPAFAAGTLGGIAAGTLVLVFGHTILTFLKIMEGFLQGIRLHYVEMFGWFFEGGGKKYAPFGANQS